MQNVISGQGRHAGGHACPCRFAASACRWESIVRVSATGGAMTRLDVPILGFFLDRGERMGIIESTVYDRSETEACNEKDRA